MKYSDPRHRHCTLPSTVDLSSLSMFESDNSITPPPHSEPPSGTISVDCDTLEDYARGYGFEFCDRPNRIFTDALPRFLEVFREAGVRATFFVIGRDLVEPEHRAVFEQALAEGHELANHTWSHPRQFAGLTWGEKYQEVRRTHDLVAAQLGVEMQGFRAPCYDMNSDGAMLIERLGYRYDSSVHPSPVVSMFDLVVWIKSFFRKWELRSNCLVNGFAPAVPYFPSTDSLWRRGEPRSLIELPTNVWPWLRIPFYGTWHLMFGAGWFRNGLNLLARCRIPLNYHFHAVELLGLHEDAIDLRFSCHPGMQLPLVAKIELIRNTILSAQDTYRLMTTAELACEAAENLTRSNAVELIPGLSACEEALCH